MLRHLIVIVALCSCLVSAPGCATLTAPDDNLNASPLQLVTAAKYEQAAFDKVAATTFAAAYAHTPSAACATLKAAAALSAANRAKIDAFDAMLQSDDAAASADWSVVIDLVFTGVEVTSTITDAKANAQATLRPDIPADELMSRYGRASGNYDAAAHMLMKAVEKCGG